MASLSHNSNRYVVQYKRPVATWPPMGVVSHSVCFDHARTLNTWKTIVTDTDQIRISICKNIRIRIVRCRYDQIRIQKIDIRAPLVLVKVRGLPRINWGLPPPIATAVVSCVKFISHKAACWKDLIIWGHYAWEGSNVTIFYKAIFVWQAFCRGCI